MLFKSQMLSLTFFSCLSRLWLWGKWGIIDRGVKNTVFQKKEVEKYSVLVSLSWLNEGKWMEENPKLRALSVLCQHLVLHQSRNKLKVSSLTTFLRLSLLLCLRVCVWRSYNGWSLEWLCGCLVTIPMSLPVVRVKDPFLPCFLFQLSAERLVLLRASPPSSALDGLTPKP